MLKNKYPLLMKKPLLTTVFFLAAMFCFAQSGSINVTSVQQRNDGSGLVDVYFNLSGPADFYFIKLRASFGAETSYFPVDQYTLSGDSGPTTPGNNKHIVWDPTHEHPNRYSPQTMLMLIAYINIEGFNPCPDTPTVADFDGNTYVTVLIGDQCWMASNLNTTRDANGNSIIRHCYDNHEDNCEFYGGLYSWSTVINNSVCPAGWHVPSDAEWTQLTTYLIDTYVDINSSNVGNKLKSCRQVDSPLGDDCSTSEHPRWNSHSTHYGTNDFGFSALPGGKGSFGDLGSIGYWWSTTQFTSTDAWYRNMNSNGGAVYSNRSSKNRFYSVRCLRDN